jgi:hypothetical protein
MDGGGASGGGGGGASADASTAASAMMIVGPSLSLPHPHQMTVIAARILVDVFMGDLGRDPRSFCCPASGAGPGNHWQTDGYFFGRITPST